MDLIPNLVATVKGATNDNKAATLREVLKNLEGIKLDKDDAGLKATLEQRVAAADKAKWQSVVSHEVWQHLAFRIPKFLYFDDYYLLPGKANLPEEIRGAPIYEKREVYAGPGTSVGICKETSGEYPEVYNPNALV